MGKSIARFPADRRARSKALESFYTYAPAAIFLSALVVRFYGLTYHSLWFDEVMSTVWASRPAADIWRVGLALSEDKHPPLYYLLLHGWTLLFGPGDFAVRALGALIGALAVLPTYGIGRMLGGRRAALIAALLVALNPFLVWYSQEARMFMPATTFALVGLYGVLTLDEGRKTEDERELASVLRPSSLRDTCAAPGVRPRCRCGSQSYVVLGFTAALYTYLFSAFLLPVAGAWVLWLWWTSRSEPGAARRLLTGVISLAVVALLFLPLARSAWLVSGEEAVGGRPFEAMLPALWRLLPIYTVGQVHWPANTHNIVATCSALLLLLGLIVPASNPKLSSEATAFVLRHRSSVLLALWLAIPLLIGGVLLARDRTVFAETRYFIFLVPALCVAWGRGLAWLWERQRTAGAAFTALALIATIAALPAVWSPENRREAWREAASFVAAHAGPDDAVLVHADYVHVAFERYFPGPQPVFYPFTEPLSDPAQVDPPLEGLAGYDAVWLVQSHHETLDPGNLVAGWFGARYPQMTEVYPQGIVVRGYRQRYRAPVSEAVPGALPAPVDLGPLRLLGCAYTPSGLRARDDVYHPPSGWLHVRTFWTVTDTPAADVLPQARLVDAAGQVWGAELERGGDAFHVWPTSRWLPGEAVQADQDVNLNPVTPPGAYRLVIQAPGFAGSADCGTVEVVP